MGTYQKPTPAPDADSAPFWRGCREHRLLLQRCGSCAAFRFPAAAYCPTCGSDVAEWVAASGRGSIYSWIVVVHPVPGDMYRDDVPYAVALVDLEEGVRMPTNIVGCDPQAIEAGMAVTVEFDDVSAVLTLPKFRPA